MDIQRTSVSLEDGQAWDDAITITLPRDQAVILLTALGECVAQAKDAVKQLSRKAEDGDVIADLLGPHIVESTNLLINGTRALFDAVAPEDFVTPWGEGDTEPNPFAEPASS